MWVVWHVESRCAVLSCVEFRCGGCLGHMCMDTYLRWVNVWIDKSTGYGTVRTSCFCSGKWSE